MNELVIGTKNRSKLKEIKEIFADLPLNCLDLSNFPNCVEVEEDGSSFEENARKKASGYALQTGKWVLAEDSGLVVPVLHGEPGIHSARYAGGHGNDNANNCKLLEALKNFPVEKRDAFYVCSAALANPRGEVVGSAEGKCFGTIIADYLGQGGFGYDPLFLVLEYHQTFGQLTSLVKHSISHRCRALSLIRPSIWRNLIKT